MDLTPSQTAMRVGLVMLGGLVIVLAIFLAITWWLGDPTSHQEENQPTTPPSSSAHQLDPRSVVPGRGQS